MQTKHFNRIHNYSSTFFLKESFAAIEDENMNISTDSLRQLPNS